MKTINQVKAERPEYKTLISAVINRIGSESTKDVINHGADAGFSGFIYYNDTHPFAMRHRKTIVKMLEQQADEFGEEVVEMVSHFGVFRKSPMDNEDRKELYRYLSGAKCEQSTITNLMAWYALEEVCRMFEE
jgi:hypothetical protein